MRTTEKLVKLTAFFLINFFRKEDLPEQRKEPEPVLATLLPVASRTEHILFPRVSISAPVSFTSGFT